MIHRKLPDGWHVFFREDETEVLRVQIPEDATVEDLQRFSEHLLKLFKEEKLHGAS